MEPLGLVLIAALCTVLVTVAGWMVSSSNARLTALTDALYDITAKLASLDGRYMVTHDWIIRLKNELDAVRHDREHQHERPGARRGGEGT